MPRRRMSVTCDAELSLYFAAMPPLRLFIASAADDMILMTFRATSRPLAANTMKASGCAAHFAGRPCALDDAGQIIIPTSYARRWAGRRISILDARYDGLARRYRIIRLQMLNLYAGGCSRGGDELSRRRHTGNRNFPDFGIL